LQSALMHPFHEVPLINQCVNRSRKMPYTQVNYDSDHCYEESFSFENGMIGQ
jgi:hypothetical protein